MPTLSTLALTVAFIALLVVAGCLSLLCLLKWSGMQRRLEHITSHIAAKQELQPSYGYILYFARIRADGLGAVRYGAVHVSDPTMYLLHYQLQNPEWWLIGLACLPLSKSAAELLPTMPPLPDGI